MPLDVRKLVFLLGGVVVDGDSEGFEYSMPSVGCLVDVWATGESIMFSQSWS